MRESKQHTFDGFTYTIQQLGAKEGRVVLARIARIVAAAAAGEGADESVAKLAEKLTDAEVNFLCDTFTKTTQVAAEGTDKVLRLEDVFDSHFAGQYGAMLKWLWAALETNFGSFFANLGVDPAALASGVTNMLKSSTPTSPTASSGASSSPASGASSK
jgi:hypothetical protein